MRDSLKILPKESPQYASGLKELGENDAKLDAAEVISALDEIHESKPIKVMENGSLPKEFGLLPYEEQQKGAGDYKGFTIRIPQEAEYELNSLQSALEKYASTHGLKMRHAYRNYGDWEGRKILFYLHENAGQEKHEELRKLNEILKKRFGGN